MNCKMTVYKNNKSAMPSIESDGEIVTPLPVAGCFETNENWYKGLSPWQRLNLHQTYSSVQRHINYRRYRITKDHLDYILTAAYQHNEELFPDPCDVHIQPITVSQINVFQQKVNNEKQTGKEFSKIHHKTDVERDLPTKLYTDHRLIIGGIKERVHPSSIKLMNTSHHSPQTNAGYVRQDRDGNLFQY